MDNLFSDNLKQVIQQSIQICQKNSCQYVMPSHLFKALENVKGSLAFDILTQLKPLQPAKQNNLKKNSNQEIKFHSETIDLIQKATIIAYQHRSVYIGTEHLLAAIFELPVPTIKKITSKNLPIKRLQEHLSTVLNSSSNIPNFLRKAQLNLGQFTANEQIDQTWHHFTDNLTNKERQKSINPVIGREKELQRIIQIISRKDKNNPIILGEAGVGKTAIVEGLAKMIVEKSVPPILQNKKILSLDLGLLVAGTMYRGEFENRLKQLIEEIENNENIILFIDELHNIMGAGSANGSMDAANLLKPLLARGKLRCIGATTHDEYKKHIETDPALERRFQPIFVTEPSLEDTQKILEGIKENYQKFHQVLFSPEAIETVIKLSNKYLPDKLLPDKAIDLLDETAAKIKINKQSKDKNLIQKIELEEKLSKTLKNKEQAILNENFSKAIKLKETENTIKKELEKINRIFQSKTNLAKVTAKDIVEHVAEKTSIPVQELTENELNKMDKIFKTLKTEIFGQDKQIKKIVEIITQAKLGLTDEDKPLASFLFLGPSGSGKTYTAKKIAQHLYQNSESLIYLDLSEYTDRFQTTKLVGAPAGYIGYRESNKFTDLVKKNPYSLILLDNINKAHPEVINLFTQVLEHGHLTDGTGRKISFQNTIIICTANIKTNNSIGFGAQQEIFSRHKLKDDFNNKILDLIDDIIIFNHHSTQSLQKIIKSELEKLVKKLKDNNIELEFTTDVITHLAKESKKQNSTTPNIKSMIFEHIQQPVIDKILKNHKSSIVIKKNKNQIVIK